MTGPWNNNGEYRNLHVRKTTSRSQHQDKDRDAKSKFRNSSSCSCRLVRCHDGATVVSWGITSHTHSDLPLFLYSSLLFLFDLSPHSSPVDVEENVDVGTTLNLRDDVFTNDNDSGIDVVLGTGAGATAMRNGAIEEDKYESHEDIQSASVAKETEPYETKLPQKKTLKTCGLALVSLAAGAIIGGSAASISSSSKSKISSMKSSATTNNAGTNSNRMSGGKSGKSNCCEDFIQHDFCMLFFAELDGAGNDVITYEEAYAFCCSPADTDVDISCMSGNTGLTKVNGDGSTDVVTVKNAVPGDVVKGLDNNLHETDCEVVTTGYWGMGPLYGNYTDDHYIYNSTSGNVVEHGKVGKLTFEGKYVLLSTCPVVLDESGVAFTPVDVFMWPSASVPPLITWDYYLRVFKIILASGTELPTLLDKSAYVNVAGLFDDLVANPYDLIWNCATEGAECLLTVDVLMQAAESYTEPTKSAYMTSFGPLFSLRDVGDEAAIQQALASMFGM